MDSPPITPSEPRPDADALPDITVSRGALCFAEAGEVFVSMGGIGAARADRVSLEFGGIGAAAGREVRLSMASAGVVAGQDVRMEQALVRTVLAGRVHLGRGSAAGIVLAGRVDGEGRPLLDWRGGLALGAAAGLAWLLVRRLG